MSELFSNLSKRKLAVIVAAVAAAFLLFPQSDFVTPDWTVFVTDTNSQPIEGAEVTVFSQQYTVESTDHEESRQTDRDGRVHFDQRRVSAIRLHRYLGVLLNILSQGAHAGFGVHTHVAAFKKGYGDPSELKLFGQNEREATANGLARQNSHIVLLQCDPGYSGIGCDFPDDPEKPIRPFKR